MGRRDEKGTRTTKKTDMRYEERAGEGLGGTMMQVQSTS